MKGLEQLAKLGQGFEKEELEHVELMKKGSFDDIVRDKDHNRLITSDESKLFSSIQHQEDSSQFQSCSALSLVNGQLQ